MAGSRLVVLLEDTCLVSVAKTTAGSQSSCVARVDFEDVLTVPGAVISVVEITVEETRGTVITAPVAVITATRVAVNTEISVAATTEVEPREEEATEIAEAATVTTEVAFHAAGVWATEEAVSVKDIREKNKNTHSQLN